MDDSNIGFFEYWRKYWGWKDTLILFSYYLAAYALLFGGLIWVLLKYT